MKNLLAFKLAILLSISLLQGRDYHVNPNGNDGNDGSSQRPWKTLRHACSQVPASQGHTIILSAGTFVESGQCYVPAGVTLKGAGIDKTILTGTGSLLGRGNPFELTDQHILRISGNNISVSNFSIDGRDKSVGGGIYCRNASSIEISNIKVSKVHAGAVWVLESQDVYVHDIEAQDCSWSSSGWASGAIHYGKCEDVTFERVNVQEVQQRNGSEGGGNAFKALGGGVLTRVKFIECSAEVYWYGTWQDGKAKNISLEFESVYAYGCEVLNCYFNASVSLVGDGKSPQPDAGGEPYSVRFAGNTIINTAGSNTLELALPESLIENNYFDNKAGGYGIKNWNANTPGKSWIVRNNVFWMQSSGWPTCVVGSRGGVQDLTFTNNTVHLTGPHIAVIAVYGPRNSGSIRISKNIIFRTREASSSTEPGEDLMLYVKPSEGYHPISNMEVQQNIFYNFPEKVDGDVSNLRVLLNENRNPQLKMAGKKPFPFYDPKPLSPASLGEVGASFISNQDINTSFQPVPEPENALILHPNPLTQPCTVAETLGKGELLLVDLQGKRIFSGTVSGGDRINLPVLPRGMYLATFHVEQEGKQYYQKLINP